MQIPIASGIYTDNSPSIRTSYPLNLTPVFTQTGISNGYLRPADGLVSFATGPGIDRGGINWEGVHYRVMGSKLVSISSSGTVTTIGDVEAGGDVSLTYSFDRLAIASNQKLFYWDGSTLTEVTDPDLGAVNDVIWVDGYFMTTDGEFLVVTELADPTAVDPSKYGSAEIDPDAVMALKKVRNEVHAVGRYTIEVFRSVSNSLFPFQRIQGAQVTKGAVGTHAVIEFKDSLFFVGSGRNERLGAYFAINGGFTKISTREIDEILEGYTEAEMSECVVEYRSDRTSEMIFIHLKDRTLVYNHGASQQAGEQVWSILSSGLGVLTKYRARHMVYVYNQWFFGDTNTATIGTFSDEIGEHFGNKVNWEFGTGILYNEGNGAIFSELELVALPGRIALGATPRISTSYSVDGVNWSQDKSISVGTIGDLTKRLVWYKQGHMRNYRIQRFRGDSSAHISFLRLEAQLSPLSF